MREKERKERFVKFRKIRNIKDLMKFIIFGAIFFFFLNVKKLLDFGGLSLAHQEFYGVYQSYSITVLYQHLQNLH